MNLRKTGVKYKIDSPTKKKAIPHVRNQIGRKFLLNPTLIDTIAKLTKNVVIKLIKLAKMISSFLWFSFVSVDDWMQRFIGLSKFRAKLGLIQILCRVFTFFSDSIWKGFRRFIFPRVFSPKRCVNTVLHSEM